MWCWSSSSWTYWQLLLSEICWIKGNICCLMDFAKKTLISMDFAENRLILACQNPINIGMHMDAHELVQTCYDDTYCQILHFDFALKDLDLHSRLKIGKKAKSSVPIIKLIFQWNLVSCWGLLIWWSHALYLFWSIAKWEKSTEVMSLKNTKLACAQKFTDWFLSNLVWWQTLSTRLFHFKIIAVWITLTVIQGHKCRRKWKICAHFLADFSNDLDATFMIMLPQPVGLFKLLLKFCLLFLSLFGTVDFQGRECDW